MRLSSETGLDLSSLLTRLDTAPAPSLLASCPFAQLSSKAKAIDQVAMLLHKSNTNETTSPMKLVHPSTSLLDKNMTGDERSNKRLKHSNQLATLCDDKPDIDSVILLGSDANTPIRNEPRSLETEEDSSSSSPCSSASSSDSEDDYDSPRSSSESSTAHDSKHVKKRSVRFSVVQIQEYSLTLGDHPYADCYPMSLDWEHTSEKEMDLSQYENTKASHQPHMLSIMQRRVRLSVVSGLHPSELAKQEEERRSAAEREALADLDDDYMWSDFDWTPQREMTRDEPSVACCLASEDVEDFSGIFERSQALSTIDMMDYDGWV